jgi:hypothetical protein
LPESEEAMTYFKENMKPILETLKTQWPIAELNIRALFEDHDQLKSENARLVAALKEIAGFDSKPQLHAKNAAECSICVAKKALLGGSGG